MGQTPQEKMAEEGNGWAISIVESLKLTGGYRDLEERVFENLRPADWCSQAGHEELG